MASTPPPPHGVASPISPRGRPHRGAALPAAPAEPGGQKAPSLNLVSIDGPDTPSSPDNADWIVPPPPPPHRPEDPAMPALPSEELAAQNAARARRPNFATPRGLMAAVASGLTPRPTAPNVTPRPVPRKPTDVSFFV